MNDLTTSTAPSRLTSLDAMRGFTIAAMILVNYPGNGEFIFEPLEHAAWDGLTPTDLIFPFFLFIVGVSIVLAFTKAVEQHTPKAGLYKKIVVRSLKIFAVGLFLTLLPHFHFSELRFTGVLQRIAIVFMVCSFLFLNASFRTLVWIGAITLVTYWLALYLIPTPGQGKVMLAPGYNLAAWVDSKLLPGKMWQGTWDPEGILSTFPAIVTGIGGMLAGHLLVSKQTPYEKVILLMVCGFTAVVIGYVWHLGFPVNKNLWSSSFVMVTGGLAALVLGTSYYVVDIRQYTRGTLPGIIFGANAIAVYFTSDVISYLFYLVPFGGAPLNEHFFLALTHAGVAPKIASVLYAFLFVCINFVTAYVLYRKKIFIKL